MVPTGFNIANSPITNSGTLAISFAAGYSLPTTAKQGQWDQAFADLGQARTPTAHKSTHATGGADALSPADIGAATAAQGAKADTAVQPAELTKAAVGLGNVDNTSDANKPVSTAMATALAGKVDATDSRLSDPRTPTAHKSTHATGGLDALTPADIGAASTAAFTSSTAGLVPASGGGTANFLRADGNFAAPPGGTPGGTSGQLQWNNAGAFAGVSTTSVDGSGNLTFTARWIQSAPGAASAPPMSLTGTWFSGGTTTTTKPQFLIEPAGTSSTNWSSAGTGFGVNAPSGFTGDLAWFGVNGINRVAISASSATIGGANYSCRVAFWDFSGQTGNLNSDIRSRVLGFGSDVLLTGDAADTLALRRATNAQAFRLYNTFTSTTNFERLNVCWTSNEAIIGTEAGSGGGTLRGLKIGSAATSPLGFYGATPAVQPAAVANATDASTVITQLNALLARLRTIGLVAT